jgi:hypothetical protein
MYDTEGELQPSIGAALSEVKRTIRELGQLRSSETVLYDGAKQFKPFHLVHRNGYIWNGNQRASPKSKGELTFSTGGIIRVQRENSDGR